ncbi:MAG: DEAD/DEAH box helicase [Bacilli bacterium]|nr:DEAD/DEAH box helicase [Bacilli bacterium]MDD3422047.1 DEAD/DEAH box helicase [Bacilli bacterium]MDD4065479.1 DEAD/DEAH box helicase [Bacilli bacterium]
MRQFTDFSLKPEIIDTLYALHFKDPTSIQSDVIPLALKGYDIIGRSETGSGKTHAFLIPIINNIDLEENKVQTIIMAPTRELAVQLYNMAAIFTKKMPKLKLRLMSGGLDRVKMIEKAENVPHIIIGTPGRIKDIAFERGILNITTAKTIVIDEADMTLESGFLDEVEFILNKMNVRAQIMAFSATLPPHLIADLSSFMHNPKIIDRSPKQKTSANVTHVAYPTRNHDKKEVLWQLMSNINPYLCIIFASRKETVNEIYEFLKQKDKNIGIIHADLDATTRRVNMKRIQNNEFRYIVASDIAARGIDIDGVSDIINYDLPYEQEFYFHRCGRCGRGKYDGTAYTLYDKDELQYLERLARLGVDFEHREFQNGVLVNLKPLFTKPKKRKKVEPGQKEITKIVNQSKVGKVKPGYKKKRDKEIHKVRQKYKQEMIKKDIRRQLRLKARQEAGGNDHE